MQPRMAIDSFVFMVVWLRLHKSFRGFRSNSTSPLIRLLMYDSKQSQTAFDFVAPLLLCPAILFYAVSLVNINEY